jgi:hypothetical protein
VVTPGLLPNNGLSGLFSWIKAYRRQNFLLNLSTSSPFAVQNVQKLNFRGA